MDSNIKLVDEGTSGRYNLYSTFDKRREGKKMKKIIEEFKTFINRGNVIDMAIGIIIGGAFKSIVDSLVADVINPVLGIIGGKDLSALTIPLRGDATLNYGNFISSILNFLIMAVVIFSIVKIMNTVADKFKKKSEEVPAVPTTKQCPFCKSEIVIEATRCPHCTSVIEE